MEYLGWIIMAIVFGLPMTYAILTVAGEMRAESRIRKRVAATRRTEVIDGKEYTVVTKSLPIVREKRTGRIGLVMERGGENDPNTVNGKLVMEPRWIKVPFIRKSDGKAGCVEWRQYQKFEIVDTADVDFLAHRSGFFRTDSFIRYPVNFKTL